MVRNSQRPTVQLALVLGGMCICPFLWADGGQPHNPSTTHPPQEFRDDDVPTELRRLGATVVSGEVDKEEFGGSQVILRSEWHGTSNDLNLLRRIPDLERLAVLGVAINDDDLKQVDALNRLNTVELYDTMVTAEAAARFAKMHPGIKIDYRPRIAPGALADKATTALREKDYDRAVVLLRTAISSHPNDAGRRYDPWTLGLLEKGALDHGRAQLAKMLSDRPQMSRYIRPSDNLWKWTASKYATRILGSAIEWDSSAPSVPNTEAEHTPPWNGASGSIRVTRIAASTEKNTATFDRLWSRVIFELHNMENVEAFQRIEQQALDGEISEDAFVKAMFLQEWKAMERTRKWYVEVYLPHAKKYELPTNPENWFCSWWGSADKCFSGYTDRMGYPWNPYSSYFRAMRDYGSIGRFFKDAAGTIRNVNALLNRE